MRTEGRTRSASDGSRELGGPRIEERAPILAGELFDAGEYRASGRGFTEVEAPGHHVVFQLSGLYVDRTSGDDEVVPPGTLSFFRPGRKYRTGDALGASSHSLVLTLHPQADEDYPHLARLLGNPDGLDALRVSPGVTLAARRALHEVRASGTAVALEELADDVERALVDATTTGPERTARIASASKGSTRRAHLELVADALELVVRDPGHPWSLAELARRTHSSPYHLSRLVRSLSGHALGEWIARARVLRAAELLAENQFSLDGVARACGYSHRGPLSALFRRYVGESPGRYRRSIAAG